MSIIRSWRTFLAAALLVVAEGAPPRRATPAPNC